MSPVSPITDAQEKKIYEGLAIGFKDNGISVSAPVPPNFDYRLTFVFSNSDLDMTTVVTGNKPVIRELPAGILNPTYNRETTF